MSPILETAPVSPDNRRVQQYVLGRLGTAWLHGAPADAQDYAEQFGYGATSRTLPERYDDLADLVFADFCIFAGNDAGLVEPKDPSHILENHAARRELVASISSGEEWEVLSGFNVIGATLSYAPAAYRSMIGDKPQTQYERAQQLGKILGTQQSFDRTVGFLAGLEHDANQTWESKLGLRPNDRLPVEGCPFVIEDTELGPVYDINHTFSVGLEGKPARGCPVKGVLLRKFWLHMIDICVESEFLFALDLRG